MRLIRSALRVLLAVVVGMLALVTLAIVAGRALLSTDRGQAWAAGKVTAAINSGIAGRVAIDRVDLHGLWTVRARGVRILRPDGGEILRASALEATPRPLSLLSKEVVLEEVRATNVTGALDEDADGDFEIAQAFSPRRAPAAPSSQAGSTGPGRTVLIRRYDLRAGAVRYGTRDQPPIVAITGGVFHGSIAIGSPLRFTVEAAADAATPVAGPTRVRVRGSAGDNALQFQQLSATLPGGTRVDAAPGVAARGPHPAAGPLDGLEFRAVVPEGGLVPWSGPRLAAPVHVEGGLTQNGPRLGLDARIAPSGPGAVLASGALITGKPARFSVTLRFRGVDPAMLVVGAPRGALWLEAVGAGVIASPPDSALDLQFTLGPTTLNGQRLESGRAALALRGEQWRARDVRLEGPGLRLAGRAAYSPRSGVTGALRADVRDLRAAERLVEAFAPDANLPPVRGSARAFARLDGEPGARGVTVRVRSPALAVRDQVVQALRANVRLANGQLQGSAGARTARGPVAVSLDASQPTGRSLLVRRLQLRIGAGHWALATAATAEWGRGRIRIGDLILAGTGRVEVSGSVPDLRVRRRGAVVIHATVDRFPVGLAAALLDARARAAGFVSAAVDVSGTLAAPRVDARLSGSSLAWDTFAVPAASATVRVEGSRGTVTALAFGGTTGRARLNADVDSADRPLLSAEGLRAARTTAVLDVADVDLMRLSNARMLPLPAAGRITAHLAARGPLARPGLTGTVTLRGFAMESTQLGAIPPTDAQVSFEAGETASVADLQTATARMPRITAHLDVARNLVELVRARDGGETPVSGTVQVGPGPLQVPEQNLVVHRAELRATLSGTLAQPYLDLDGALRGIVTNGQPLGDVTLAARGGGKGLSGKLRGAAGARGGPLLADFDVDPRSPERWNVSVEAHHTPIDFLAVLPPIVELDSGEIDGRLVAHGAADGGAPDVTGHLAIRAERFTTAQVGTLRQVELDLEASTGHVSIRKAAARAQGGRLQASGDIAFASGRVVTNLKLELSRFPLPAPAMALAEVTTQAQLNLTERPGAIDGDLKLSRGELVVPDLKAGGERFPTTLPKDIEIHQPGSAPPRPAARSRAPLVNLPIVLRITVPDGFAVRSPEANAVFGMKATMRMVEGRPTLAGNLNVTAGTVILVGRRFQIDRLALLFTDGPEMNPGLDGQLSLQQGETTVLAQVTGTVRKPELQLQSNPPLDPSQIALLVAGGGAGATGGTGANGLTGDSGGAAVSGAGSADVALSSAISLLAGQLGGALGGALPIDVFNVQLGTRGEAERIEAGTYVTPRLFLSFVRNLFAGPGENFNEVVAEYQLRRSLSLRSRYGDRESGGVSLLWEKRYRSPDQKKK